VAKQAFVEPDAMLPTDEHGPQAYVGKVNTQLLPPPFPRRAPAALPVEYSRCPRRPSTTSPDRPRPRSRASRSRQYLTLASRTTGSYRRARVGRGQLPPLESSVKKSLSE
jgi:hypothetical protein